MTFALYAQPYNLTDGISLLLSELHSLVNSMSGTIPRFLLPQRSSIWRSRTISPSKAVHTIRNASHKAPPKANTTPITPKVPVLEKPERFNPPSHGARLPNARLQYSGPPLSEAQRAAQKTKRYPNMMPNEGTFLHWFLNNRSIHIYITLVLPPISLVLL